MNVVREIQRINEQELKLGLKGASWHDEYKDSAYVYVGGLDVGLTEGDVITIFSQYGEIMDVNLPREKETGKARGFGFLMYEDQRSTVLAVDNLNGATVAGRTLRVDHVKNYKQPKVKGEEGEMVERDEQSLNAKPEMVVDDEGSEESDSSGPEIDPEDPMAAYMLQKRKEEKEEERKKGSKKGKSSKHRHKDETPEERRARKERKRAKKALKQSKKSSGLRGVEEMLERMNASGGPERSNREDAVDRKHERRSRSPKLRRSPRYEEGPRRSWLPEDRVEHRDTDDNDRDRRGREDSRERRRDIDSRDRDSYRCSPSTHEARRQVARAARRRTNSLSKSPP